MVPRSEGVQQGKRDIVRHQIEKRFGPISSHMEEQLLRLSPPELGALALRLLDAKTADELFA